MGENERPVGCSLRVAPPVKGRTRLEYPAGRRKFYYGIRGLATAKYTDVYVAQQHGRPLAAKDDEPSPQSAVADSPQGGTIATFRSDCDVVVNVVKVRLKSTTLRKEVQAG